MMARMVVWGDIGSENAAPIGPTGGIAKIGIKIGSKLSCAPADTPGGSRA